jgi:hypothetical protein
MIYCGWVVATLDRLRVARTIDRTDLGNKEIRKFLDYVPGLVLCKLDPAEADLYVFAGGPVPL